VEKNERVYFLGFLFDILNISPLFKQVSSLKQNVQHRNNIFIFYENNSFV